MKREIIFATVLLPNIRLILLHGSLLTSVVYVFYVNARLTGWKAG